MLKLIDFKNKHEGQDVYVIGSGPSCDFIDPSFFENKITVGTNQTYKKFNSKYLVRKEHNLLQQTLNEFDGITLVSRHNAGCGKQINILEYQNTEKLCIYDHRTNDLKLHLNKFHEENKLLVAYSTIITSIHFAYYIGAKNIILVGVDHGSINGKITFEGYYDTIKQTPWQNWQEYKTWLTQLNESTILFKKYLNALGINVYSLNPFINMGLEGNIYE